jgi:hypothetical protein
VTKKEQEAEEEAMNQSFKKWVGIGAGFGIRAVAAAAL